MRRGVDHRARQLMRINSYLQRQVFTAMFFIIIALTVIIWLTQSLRFIELIVNRGLPFSTFLYLTVLLMPAWLAGVLPIAVFAAVLFVYNRLINDRELIIISAVGVSPARLARPALVCAGVTVLACYAMTLYLQPVGYRAFKELQFSIRHNYANILLREGVFTNIAPGVTLFVRERTEAGKLRGILIHDARDANETATVIAERGSLLMTPTGPQVVMENGNRQTRNVVTKRLTLLYFDRYAIDLTATSGVPQRTSRDRNELFVTELFSADNVQEGAVLNRQTLENHAEGHRRLSSPLLAITLVLVAIASLFSGEFSRRGQGLRIALAIGSACAVQAAFLAARYFAVRTPGLEILFYLVIVAPVIIMILGASFRRRARAAGPA